MGLKALKFFFAYSDFHYEVFLRLSVRRHSLQFRPYSLREAKGGSLVEATLVTPFLLSLVALLFALGGYAHARFIVSQTTQLAASYLSSQPNLQRASGGQSGQECSPVSSGTMMRVNNFLRASSLPPEALVAFDVCVSAQGVIQVRAAKSVPSNPFSSFFGNFLSLADDVAFAQSKFAFIETDSVPSGLPSNPLIPVSTTASTSSNNVANTIPVFGDVSFPTSHEAGGGRPGAVGGNGDGSGTPGGAIGDGRL